MVNVFKWFKNLLSNTNDDSPYIERKVSYQEYKNIIKSSNDVDKIEEVTIKLSTKNPGEGEVLLKLKKPENYREKNTKRVVHKDKPINMRQPSYREDDRG